MPMLAAAVDSGGIVLSLLANHHVSTPVLSEACNDSDLAGKIPAFEAKTLPARERAKLIAHAKKCGPCCRKLGWGEL